MPKRKIDHLIDSSGVLEAAKIGNWDNFKNRLDACPELSYEHFNELPPGRSFGVVHQICYHGNRTALEQLLNLHPRADLKMVTKGGQTPLEVAQEEGASNNFLKYLNERLRVQSHHELLNLASSGRWERLFERLNADPLPIEIINSVPAGRSFGLVHQICYHGNRNALEQLLNFNPRVDLKLVTKSGKTPIEVALIEEASNEFLEYLKERLRLQSHHELVNLARGGKWESLFERLNTDPLPIEIINSVPQGRIWGILHQVCFWGDISVLNRLIDLFPDLDLELETVEEAAQHPRDIALGRGHTPLEITLKKLIDEKKPKSLVTAPSAAMKVPVPAAGKLCRICFMEDHEEGTLAVSCDNDHYMCQTCFSSWVETESDIENNPQNILLNGGRITCPCKKSDGCDSLAYANKLIAMIVSDELYEKYLRARDYVVGKEAVAGALSKISGGDMSAVEQEQIRNMYRKADGTYSAYMCGQCNFGPVDHGWCDCLVSHQGEEKEGGATINNACPKCGWFAEDIDEWPRWDGKFQPS